MQCWKKQKRLGDACKMRENSPLGWKQWLCNICMHTVKAVQCVCVCVCVCVWLDYSLLMKTVNVQTGGWMWHISRAFIKIKYCCSPALEEAELPSSLPSCHSSANTLLLPPWAPRTHTTFRLHSRSCCREFFQVWGGSVRQGGREELRLRVVSQPAIKKK